MTIQERIDLGREYAHGINRMVDIEVAYQLWYGLDSLLSDEDKEIYNIILEILDERHEAFCQPAACRGVTMTCANSFFDGNFGGSPSNYTMQIAAKNRTEDEVVALFEDIVKQAAKNKKLGVLYSSLELFSKNQLGGAKPKKERKPENIIFGNNLGFLILHYWSSVDLFLETLNEYRINEGLDPKKSRQGIYQVIAGENGMDNSSKLILVKMVNDKNRTASARKRMVRPLAATDLNGSLTELTKLFVSPRIDDKIQKILDEEAQAAH